MVRSTRVPLLAAASAALLLTLTACGTETGAATGSGGASSEPSRTSAPGRPAAVYGTITALSGKTMHLRSRRQGQVAVTYTSSTVFTRQVSAARARVKVGVCVVVTPSAAATENGTNDSRTVVASFVRSAPAVGRRCRVGFDGPWAGRVTAVSRSGFTLKARARSSGKQVIVSAATRYSTLAGATAGAVAMGRCASVEGTRDARGSITATWVSLAGPVGGACGMGHQPLARTD